MTVNPQSLRNAADFMQKASGVDPTWLREAADEIESMRAALTQFVAACETAPPTSLMIEIGMACKVAKRALALPSDQCGGGA